MLPLAAAPTLAHPTSRASVSSSGAQGNGFSFNPDLSFTGRFVLFNSAASNLVEGDANGVPDIFLRDRTTGRTTLVSVSSAGVQGDKASDATWLSWLGRYAFFQSESGTLAPNDTNGFCDAFLRDLWQRTTTRVSVGPGGAQGDECSFAAGISGLGRYLLVNTFASNLAPVGGPGHSNLLVKDRRTGRTTVATVGPGGEPSDAAIGDRVASRVSGGITADGRWVAFSTTATNMVAGDSNGQRDVFRRDRQAGRTALVSVNAGGAAPANGASTFRGLSEDGNLVVFSSNATDLVAEPTTPGRTHVYVRDMAAGRTWRISRGLGGAEADNSSGGIGPVSFNGRFVLFNSAASNLVAGDTNAAPDTFVHDLRTGANALVSRAADGGQIAPPGVFIGSGDLSPDGSVVAFVSAAPGVVPGDTNGALDVFVRQR